MTHHSDDDTLQRQARKTLYAWRHTGWKSTASIEDAYGPVGFHAKHWPGVDLDPPGHADPRLDAPPIRYVVGCKNYQAAANGLYNGRYASFMPKLVGAALTTNQRAAPVDDEAVPRAGDRHPRRKWLVLFAGEPPYGMADAWVFDPERVYSHGERETVPRTKRTSATVRIFQLDAFANGVKLGDHLSGRERPEPAREAVDVGRQVTFREVEV